MFCTSQPRLRLLILAFTLGLVSLFPDLSSAQQVEPIGPSSRRTGLIFSEIMYHPADRTDGKNLEYIELHNSNPFAHPISGYRLSGDIDYTFPTNVVIPPHGYLVVAKVPTDVQTFFKLTKAFGPYTNDLPNSAGQVRLRNRAGAILLEAEYDSRGPWPLAADGGGHSLILGRPSYGEKNPRAYTISEIKGGSAGYPETNRTEAIRNVVINEIYPGDAAQPGFIELFNTSASAVDLSGALLSDNSTTHKFKIPTGTSLPGGRTISFPVSQLGFQPSQTGGSTGK